VALFEATGNNFTTRRGVPLYYVLASLGFEALAKQVNKKPESLMRMLSEKGKP